MIISSQPAKAVEFKTGLELLIACSEPINVQEHFFSCLDEIVLRVSELSGRSGHCPKIATRDDIGWWVVNGREALVNYWSRVGSPAEAARLSPQAVIDAPLRMMGYGSCIDATVS